MASGFADARTFAQSRPHSVRVVGQDRTADGDGGVDGGVNRGIVHLTHPVPLRVMCEWRIGLASDYHPEEPAVPPFVQPYPKDGLAVSGTQRVDAIEILSAPRLNGARPPASSRRSSIGPNRRPPGSTRSGGIPSRLLSGRARRCKSKRCIARPWIGRVGLPTTWKASRVIRQVPRTTTAASSPQRRVDDRRVRTANDRSNSMVTLPTAIGGV